MNNTELAEKIFDSLSDGYDDEEYRNESVAQLSSELSQLSNNSYIINAFIRLCERIDDLENSDSANHKHT